MSGWAELEQFLTTDCRDVGFDEALRLMHVYVDLVLDDSSGAEAARRFPGVAAHLRAAVPATRSSTAATRRKVWRGPTRRTATSPD
jgi:hypothetical protein